MSGSHFFGLHWADLCVLAMYLVAMAGIGFYSYTKVRNQDDYFMGGRRFGKLLMMMFSFGSGTHADTAVAVASKSYHVGLAGIWYQWQQLLTTPIYWLIAPVFRRARCITTADFFEKRFGTSFGLLYTIDAIFINISFMGVMLFGSGRMIEALTGGAISLGWAIGSILACVVIYGVAGGLIAAVWTDFFQGILTVLMSFLLVPFMWHAVGGKAGLHEKLPDFQEAFSLHVAGEIGFFWIVMNAINSLVGMVVQPHIMANTAAGPSEFEGRFGFVSGILLKRLCTIPWALVGVLGIALYAGQDIPGDHVFGQAIRDCLPVGMVGLMIACIMASVMSTCDVLMISCSALVTRNLYLRFFANTGDADDDRMVLAARIASVVFLFFSVVLANLFDSMPQAMRFLWKTLPLLGMAFFLGLWWRRANRWGAWASFVCALCALLVGEFVFKWSGDQHLPNLMAFYLSAGFIGGILVSLFTPGESERMLDEFYLVINTPIGQEELLETQNIHRDSRLGIQRPYDRVFEHPDFEIPVPTRQSVVGFTLTALIALLMVGGIFPLVWWLNR